jgi:hypothetical protein
LSRTSSSDRTGEPAGFEKDHVRTGTE